jgi:formylglycine-generating enzyme required for sulfatase activity
MITRPYWLQATEVTQRQWAAVMKTYPFKFKDCGGDCPAEMVSWDDAVAYANRLSVQHGLEPCYGDKGFKGLSCNGYRLPTEAEWEHAARAGTRTATYAGPIAILSKNNAPVLNDIAWYGGNGGVTYKSPADCAEVEGRALAEATCGLHPVGQKATNPWGLHDMLGNVFEWVHDQSGYGNLGVAYLDPLGSVMKTLVRGGSWISRASHTRCAARIGNNEPAWSVGFRLARTIGVAPPDCRKSEACTVDGRCSLVDGQCRADTDADCEASEGCTAAGRCAAFGGGCVVRDARDCGKLKRCQGDGACMAYPHGCGYPAVLVAPGRFVMGSPPGEDGREADEAQVPVTVSRAFWIQPTEVTRAQWQAVMRWTPAEVTNCGKRCAVTGVSWEDAVEYLNQLSVLEGLPPCYVGHRFVGLGCKGYRLPTEAEWEFAARAGTTTARYGDLDDIAWHSGNASKMQHPVALKRANAWGLHDMLGGVFEWVHDWDDAYPESAVTDPQGPDEGEVRVVRGGSWDSPAKAARAAYRAALEPGQRGNLLGFRAARTAP